MNTTARSHPTRHNVGLRKQPTTEDKDIIQRTLQKFSKNTTQIQQKSKRNQTKIQVKPSKDTTRNHQGSDRCTQGSPQRDPRDGAYLRRAQADTAKVALDVVSVHLMDQRRKATLPPGNKGLIQPRLVHTTGLGAAGELTKQIHKGGGEPTGCRHRRRDDQSFSMVETGVVVALLLFGSAKGSAHLDAGLRAEKEKRDYYTGFNHGKTLIVPAAMTTTGGFASSFVDLLGQLARCAEARGVYQPGLDEAFVPRWKGRFAALVHQMNADHIQRHFGGACLRSS
ncbi:uncharacterized protein MONBRDRAFT_12986 [Monosiga brevicollis MX1]|uniref:Uncharacterized protein n=1 Tax=Monosiga brevicollis TaxID=81824 RepID=A9VDX7_MONBE|nr:uncharacterized protein MONBRDRAFT_12986 [Monosiga brevicollis MX1]EDQ84281.1 predicted protein [Monosiga brevicollis MX1]|eukprot:XP_001750911.1 hypothetical protein [Monosiga brevicollis MX1]